MTLEEMESYRMNVHMLKKVRDMKRRLLDAAYPGGNGADGGRAAVSDKTGKIGTELGDLDTEIRAMEIVVNRKKKKVEAFIGKCDNAWKRQLIRMRFCRAMKWQEIAEVVGGGNSAASVRAIVMREVKKLAENGAGDGEKRR